MSHSYSTDSPERRYIPLFIAAAAIGAAFLISHFLDNHQVKLPWWASPPIDTMAFYGLFYGLFDRYVWKSKLPHSLHITRIPDLSGMWMGYVDPGETNGVSSGLGVRIEITIVIRQTWTDILVTGCTRFSKSRSLSASLIVGDECSVTYEYLNEPFAPAPGTMHAHRGTARLTFNEGSATLNGEYYSGRDRQNIGIIHLKRI